MQISVAQHKAAGDLVDLIAGRVGSNRAVHPETAIACAARLAGSLLFRSFKLDIPAAKPGNIVLSEQANEEGPQLISIVAAMLHVLGVKLDYSRMNANRGEEPHLSAMQSLELLQEDALRIAAKHGLGVKEAAQAAAVATAFIVKECAGNIGAEIGANVAAYGFIEGSKMAPPDLEQNPIDHQAGRPPADGTI